MSIGDSTPLCPCPEYLGIDIWKGGMLRMDVLPGDFLFSEGEPATRGYK